MTITIIHGSQRHGSTYHMAHLFLQQIMSLQDVLHEFFLPRDMPSFCIGCCNCFSKGEAFCPHAAQVSPIHEALRAADLLIFTTPVYALRASGQMKTLLDHFSFLFMTHRPDPSMFAKAAVVFTSAAGGLTRGALRDIATSLSFWGVANIRSMGAAVYASEWSQVPTERKTKIAASIRRLAGITRRTLAHVRPSLKTKALFYMFRMFHKKMRVCPLDDQYWEHHGWLSGKRPWA